MRHLTFEPQIPLALWVPLALAAVALWAWYATASRPRLPHRRWMGVIALMGAALGVPLAVLLNPVWQERIPPPAGKPLLTVLVDRSASMDTADAGGGKTRYEAARTIAQEVQSALGERYEVRVRTFAGASGEKGDESNLRRSRPRPASGWFPPSDKLDSSPFSRSRTDLAAAVESGLEQDRPQGQAELLLSDGIHNAPGGRERLDASAAKAKAMAAPVFVHTLGGQEGVRDLEVGLRHPQELAFVGQRLPVAVTLTQRGSLGATTKLSLVSEGKTIDQRDAPLQADGTREEVFQVVQDKAGLYRYEVRAAPMAGEVTELDNSATLVVRVVDRPVRVLLLEGKPYWDTKFLVRTLVQDKSIELTSVVRLAEGRFLRRTITRPEAEGEKRLAPGLAPGVEPASPGVKPPEEATAPRLDRWEIEKDAGKVLGEPGALAGFQIVVLGRDAEVFLGDQALAQLKKWLEEGDGSLVCFRGPPTAQIGQRLGELMPVRWTPVRESRFRVRWTGPGRDLRWLAGAAGGEVLEDLPSLAAVTQPEKSSDLAEVLAATVTGESGQAAPAITYRPVGSGRVVVVEGAGMWRWAFLPPQYQKHDEQYGVLWRSLVRWLVSNVGLLPHEQTALRTDKVTFSADEAAMATLLVRPGGTEGRAPAVELSGGGLENPRVVAAEASGSYPGLFRVPLGRLPEGRYELRVRGPGKEVTSAAAFDVRSDLRERLDVRAQPEKMKLLADRSGGAVLALPDPEALARQFDERLAQTRPERIARTTAWDRWWVLLGAFGLWGTAWGLRRWSGLV